MVCYNFSSLYLNFDACLHRCNSQKAYRHIPFLQVPIMAFLYNCTDWETHVWTTVTHDSKTRKFDSGHLNTPNRNEIRRFGILITTTTHFTSNLGRASLCLHIGASQSIIFRNARLTNRWIVITLTKIRIKLAFRNSGAPSSSSGHQ